MSEFLNDLIKITSTHPYSEPVVRVSKGGRVTVALPRITTTPLGQQERLTLGELLVRKIEMGEDLDEAFKKVLSIGIRQPGASKEGVTKYLVRELLKAEEEGRI